MNFNCDSCNFETNFKSHYDRHMNTKNHKLIGYDEKYNCDSCNIFCDSKYNYDRHMNTKKHHDNIMGINNNLCGYCMENFAYKSLLERHNKTKYHANNVLF